MLDSLFIKYVIFLSEQELKRFYKFVQSPYFNNEKSVENLVGYLARTQSKWRPLLATRTPEKEDQVQPALAKILNREKLWKAAMGKVDYNDNRFRNILSVGTRLMKKFLMIEGLEADKNDSLRTRLIFEHLNSSNGWELMERMVRAEERNPYEDRARYGDVFELKEYWQMNLLSAYSKTKYYGGQIIEEYQRTGGLFETFFALQWLQLHVAQLNAILILNPDEEFKINIEILAWIEEKDWTGYPLIAIYLNLLKMMLSEGERKYDTEIEQLLVENEKGLSSYILKQILSLRLNNYEIWDRKGFGNFRRTIFEIVREMDQKDYLVTDGQISDSYFLKFGMEGFRCKERDWLEDYWERRNAMVVGPEKEFAWLYVECCLDYLKGRYENLLNRVFTAHTKNPILRLNLGVIRIKALYEVDEIELEDGRLKELSKLADALRKSMGNIKGIKGELHEAYSNFFRLVNRLGAVKFEGKALRPDLIRELELPNLIEKEWLGEKLEELSS